MKKMFILLIGLFSIRSLAFTTEAERSGWKRTGRYEEVQKFCDELPRLYPKQLNCLRFGRTPENRPLLVFVASKTGILDGLSNRKKNRPVVLFQGGIHAGEIDGKDAGFWALRELLKGTGEAKGVLEKVTFLFIPVLNVDGHERFGKNNRPNQVGPEEMGWRVTAHNLNLNRDYMKADSPEMRQLHALLLQWDPILYADLHVTDGAQFQHEIAVMVQPSKAGHPELSRLGRTIETHMMNWLNRKWFKPLPFYPAFVEEDNPNSGIQDGISPSRFSQAYWALHQRFGVLVETHSWKDYATRVRATYETILGLTSLAAAEGAQWRNAADLAEKQLASIPGTSVVLSYETSPASRLFDFQGFAFEKVPSDISGKQWMKYDPTKPAVWRIPLFSQVIPKVAVMAPKAGYVVPVPFAETVGGIMKSHG